MRGLESRKVENSRKVNYSWEKKSLQFFLLIYAWSFFYPALCPSPCSLLCSACSHQPLISISQPLQQQASRVGCSLFILYFLQQCRKRTKEKNVLNLKRTLAQGRKKPNKTIRRQKLLSSCTYFWCTHTKMYQCAWGQN